jgi:SWI/SNF-related matrix-associated actin-dependent regulator of chromatin subfamily A member 5
VEKSLPPKSETILFTGMSKEQKVLYKNILLRDIDSVNGAIASKSEGSRTAILNIVMQLRKCCNHPYLFPNIEDRTLPPLGPHLYQTCGKMNLMHKLLVRMKAKGHRVLVFSQMTRMLDIIEDYLVSQTFNYCRIDGSTNYEDREDRIADFNK